MNTTKIFTKYLAATVAGCASIRISMEKNQSSPLLAKEETHTKQLIGVVLVGRHGARTPFVDNLIPGIEEVNFCFSKQKRPVFNLN